MLMVLGSNRTFAFTEKPNIYNLNFFEAPTIIYGRKRVSAIAQRGHTGDNTAVKLSMVFSVS